MNKGILLAALIGGLLLTGAGCSGGGGKDNGSSGASETPVGAISKEPVTLSFLQSSAKMTDDEFKQWVADPVNKKYPNITMTLAREDKPAKLAELVASGSLPDVMYMGPATAVAVSELKAAQDLSELIKSNKMDLGKFNPQGIEVIKQQLSGGDNSKLYALPLAFNFSVLYYNKDIFDKFAAPYPKDGMFWDDAIDLARKVTRQDNNVQYYGLSIGNVFRLGEQLSLPTVDAKTLKANFQTDGWKKVFETWQKIQNIPENDLPAADAINSFEINKTLAMFSNLSARIGELEQLHNEGQPVNWDMATIPTFQQAPKNALAVSLFYLMQSVNSKHKAEAFEVIKFLTEDETQTRLSKQGRMSSLMDKKYQDMLGDDLNSLKGKNKAAIFKTVAAPLPPITLYDNIGNKYINQTGNTMAKNKNVDINTALRDAEEKANKEIEEAKNQ